MSGNDRIYPSFNPSGAGHHRNAASFPDCHWKLCRQFMDRYQSVLPEEQTYALAHIFANTQLLLRGDADQTMELVLDLVRDQRGGATPDVDQVENRCWEREAEPDVLESMEALDISGEVVVKAEPEEMEEEPVLELMAEESVSEALVEESVPETMTEETVPEVITEKLVPEERAPDCPLETKVFENSKLKIPNIEEKQTQTSVEPKDIVAEPTPEVPTKFIRVVPPTAPVSMETVYKNLILFDENFEKTQTYFNLQKCGKLEMFPRQNADLSFSVSVKIDRQVILNTMAKKRPQALTRASKLFFDDMRDHCYRIETLPSTQFLQQAPNMVQRQTASTSPERINENNVGFRLLQKIGWTGGPLGASAQGRLDPVECSVIRKGRAGIGAVVSPQFDVAHFRKIMKDFQGRNDGCHLVFSKEFTSEERSELKKIASQLRLDCRVFSLPKGVQHFVVMAKELPPPEIIRRIVIEKHAGLSAQYRVVPPKKSAGFLDANSLPAVVPVGPKVPELKKVVAKHEESDNESQFSSEEEDSPNPTNSKLKEKMSTLDPETVSQILASLTQFKPVRSIRTIEDVYHNMVIIGNKFRKSVKEFNKVGSELMLINAMRLPAGGFGVSISVGEFVLAEACDKKRNKASKAAQAAFLKKAAMFSYKLTPRKPWRNMENALARVQSPESNYEYYKSMIQEFSKNCLERELVFSTEFNDEERLMLRRIAHSFALQAVVYGPRNSRNLRIIGRALPALAILERIVVQKDAQLSERYEVTPPRIGVRS